MDPLFAAGMLAAAYDLGLNQSRSAGSSAQAPGVLQMLFGPSSPQSAAMAGLLGYAAAHHGADDVASHNEALVAALQRMAQVRSQERSEYLQREQMMRDALVQSEQHRRMLEVARWAQLAAERGAPQHYR